MASAVVDGDRRGLYVRPASHSGGPSGPEGTLPYGSRLRLKATFPVALYPPAAQVVLRTMQRYGIVLSDGGNIALTAESDHYTEHAWSDVGITPQTFYEAVPSRIVRADDFEVVDTGPRIVETWDCVRVAEPADPDALVARLLPAGSQPEAIVRLEWRDGAEAVDIYRGGEHLDTVANTGAWTRKSDGLRAAPYRVCNAESMACTDAVVALPDGHTQRPPVSARRPMAARLPAAARAPVSARTPTVPRRPVARPAATAPRDTVGHSSLDAFSPRSAESASTPDPAPSRSAAPVETLE